MKKNVNTQDLKAFESLSLSIGHFIRYWGFRRIHGAIWTQLYLSTTPLSGTDLTLRLKVSKALVSPALSELEKWKLIRSVRSENAKTKLYVATDDVNAVIQHVLKIREKKMMTKISSHLKELKNTDLDALEINSERLQKVEEMVQSAQMMLEFLLQSKDVMQIADNLQEG